MSTISKGSTVTRTPNLRLNEQSGPQMKLPRLKKKFDFKSHPKRYDSSMEQAGRNTTMNMREYTKVSNFDSDRPIPITPQPAQ